MEQPNSEMHSAMCVLVTGPLVWDKILVKGDAYRECQGNEHERGCKMAHVSRTLAVVMVSGLAASALAPAGLIEVIYSTISGHPTARVPGLTDPNGAPVEAEFRYLDTLYGSPSANHWIFKAWIRESPDEVIVAGSTTSGLVVARQGNPSPVPGRLHEWLRSRCGINDSGHYIYSSNLDGSGTDDEVLFWWDGSSQAVAVREGQPAPGLIDPDGTPGDELFGDDLDAAHILADDRFAFQGDEIQNVGRDYDSALYHGSTSVLQEGTSNGVDTFNAFGTTLGEGFVHSDASGDNWVTRADVNPSSTSATVAVVVNGFVEVREGDIVSPNLGPVRWIDILNMAGNGDWFAIGTDVDLNDWALRNGELIAEYGGPVTALATEQWRSLESVGSSGSGEYLLVGSTDNPHLRRNYVLTLNGTRVLVRRGNTVDLNGNGLPDDDAHVAYMMRWHAYPFLSSDGWLYFMAEVTGGGVDGEALLRTKVSCIGDIDTDGDIDLSDLAALLGVYGTDYTDNDFLDGADLDGNGVVELADLAALLAIYNTTCE